jgi:hypothetical protein
MTAASLIAARLNAAMTALTPIERWYAVRRLESGFVMERWLILPCIAAVVVLTLLLIVVSLHRAAEQRRLSSRLFFEYAGRLGLTARECRILQHITARVKLKRKESIFTMLPAFERGTAEITKQTLAAQGAAKSMRLSAELSVLRKKLGFERRRPASAGSDSKPGSRQIPPGKKLYITGPSRTEFPDIESTVIKNNDFELVVRLARPLECNPGELCRVRYNFGVSVWEFDAAVVSCHGGILVLDHSNEVRFINRRRFLRVPVSRPAFIARFPFARTLPPDDELSQEGPTRVSGQIWAPPEFVPAEVTELAGPGLRVEAPLEVKVGERVVVILKISEETGRNSTAHRDGTSPRPREQQSHRPKPSRIVEDIGEVRHSEVSEGGFSIAVELTGLSDSNVNELIRATNAASVKAAAASQDVTDFSGEDDGMVEALEPALVQGT